MFSGGNQVYSFDYPQKNITGVAFKQAVITCDGQNIVALAADKGHRETVVVFNAKTGAPGPKIPLKVAGVKVGNKFIITKFADLLGKTILITDLVFESKHFLM